MFYESNYKESNSKKVITKKIITKTVITKNSNYKNSYHTQEKVCQSGYSHFVLLHAGLKENKAKERMPQKESFNRFYQWQYRRRSCDRYGD